MVELQDGCSQNTIDVSPAADSSIIPNCDPNLKPYEGQIFESLEEGIQFYKFYAASCGFDIRLGTRSWSMDGTVIKSRYVLCNREGEKNVTDSYRDVHQTDGKQRRRRVSKRFGCKARVILQFVPPTGYAVKVFIEHHSHGLVSDTYKKYLKANRNLNVVHKHYILNCARTNIGPMKCYKLFKEIVGGFNNIGCTATEFKNFSRDLRAYVEGVDAQMMLDKLFRKRELCSAFYFDYTVDAKDRLTGVFWADPIARKNYSIFGDVVSFDATYDLNRYKMIFAPFTGIDNYGKCVTFGASLICGEDKEVYSWVLSKFKDCMGQSPRMIITDQDPALRGAVERSLVGTRHRLCMWHIMLKVPEKVPLHLRKDELFMQRFNSMVWTDLDEPIEFERKWAEIITDFGLEDDSWFTFMYGIREFWIPAYFRDFSMSGLFRTTSPSESVNHFYSGFISPNSNLLGFFMQFESALDSQRHTYERLNGADESCEPDLSTPLLVEKHAAKIFTNEIFLKLQTEIQSACYVCKIVKVCEHDSGQEFWINDYETGVHKVEVNKVDNYATCRCKKFVRTGLLCAHIFHIMKDLDSFPTEYVVSRWTKNAGLHPLHVVAVGFDEQLAINEENKLLLNQLVSEFYQCVSSVDGKKERISALLRTMIDFRSSSSSIEEDPESASSSKKRLFDQYYGTSLPEQVSVLPPNNVKTKGSGSSAKSRKKSNLEKAIQQLNKPLRTCSKCNRKANHDARNCPNVV